MTEYTCTRCSDPIQTPVEHHAAYVIGEDMVVSEPTTIAQAITHTDETKSAVESLKTNHYPDTSSAALERAIVSDLDFFAYVGDPPKNDSNPLPDRKENVRSKKPAIADFNHTEIVDTSEAPDGTLRIITTTEPRDVQKTGLVCKDCVQETDTVIWG